MKPFSHYWRSNILKALITASAFAVPHVYAAPVFPVSDSFNYGTTGGAPGTGWTTDTSGGTVALVAVPDSTNKSIKLSKSSTANMASATRTFTTQSGTFYIEARLMAGETAGWKSFYLREGSTNCVSLIFNNGQIALWNGTTQTNVQAFSANVWYKVKLAVDTSTDTYDLFLDGARVATNVPFRTAASTGLNAIYTEIGTGNTGNFYVDSVIVGKLDGQSSYLVYDRFNTSSAGSAPSGYTLDTSGGTVAVTAAPSAADLSVKVTKPSTTALAMATKAFTAQTGRTTVQALLKSDETAGWKNFYVQDSNGINVASIALNAGYIQNVTNSGNTNLVALAAGDWYLVKVVLDPATSKFDVYVDGIRLLKDQAFRNAGAGNVARVQLGMGSGTSGSLYFDQLFVFASPLTTSGTVVDPVSYGAVANDSTADTAAIQSAINACPSGGTVKIQGGTFITGTITLKSNMTLFIDKSATLKAIDETNRTQSQIDADYPSKFPGTASWDAKNEVNKAIIYGANLSNLVIDGGGTIDGMGHVIPNIPDNNGDGQVDVAWHVNGKETEIQRPAGIWIAQSSNVTIRNVYLTNLAMWAVVPMEIDGLVVRDVDVNSIENFNRDGMDVTDCKNVLVERVSLYSDDDALCFKSGAAVGVSNVFVRDSFFSAKRGNSIKFGTMSYQELRNVVVEDVLLKKSGNTPSSLREGSGITLQAVDGADIFNVSFNRINIASSYNPLSIIHGDRGRTPVGGTHKYGFVDTVEFNNIVGSSTLDSTGSPFIGVPTMKLYSLLFNNVDIDFMGGVSPAPGEPAEYSGQYPMYKVFGYNVDYPGWAFYFRHVNGITIQNSSFTVSPADARVAIYNSDVSNYILR